MNKVVKLLVISAFCFLNVSVGYSLTICAKSNTYIGIIKKGITGGVEDTNGKTKTWKLSFDYDGTKKIITGISACNEIDGATKGTGMANLYTTITDEGQYCWCKMEPVLAYEQETGITSYWVFHSDMSDSNNCVEKCTSACANAMAKDTTFQTAVYESIW